MAYRLRLPPKLSHGHDVLHMLMLKKYTCDPSHVLPYAEISLQPNVAYEEQPDEILARKVCLYHNKETLMVKVR